jgi:hypothetical protein
MGEVDERYKRGMVYTIRNINDETMIYVGSTINNLSKRLSRHKSHCKNGKSCSLYDCIDNNDWTNWYIELYENYPCNNKKELNRREGQVIREIGSINKNVSGRTRREWVEDNVHKVKEQMKNWRVKNPDNNKEWYKNNEDKIKENHKKYREENADKIKEWYEKNADRIKEQKKQYYKDNVDKINEKNYEKICCSICGAFSTKNHLPRHQKSKKCMSSRTNNEPKFVRVIRANNEPIREGNSCR